MAVESEEFTELDDEFALVAQTAAEAGISGSGDEAPRVRRGWVNVPAGGHVSGVFWGGHSTCSRPGTLLSFHNEKTDITVDGVPQERPVTKWS